MEDFIALHILSHPPMSVALSKYPRTKVAICGYFPESCNFAR
jgi:hypothetical protein